MLQIFKLNSHSCLRALRSSAALCVLLTLLSLRCVNCKIKVVYYGHCKSLIELHSGLSFWHELNASWRRLKLIIELKGITRRVELDGWKIEEKNSEN